VVFLREYLNSKELSGPIIKAVGTDRCQRCLSEAIRTDFHGRRICRECLASDVDILTRRERVLKPKNHVVVFHSPLTDKQQVSSRFLAELVRTGRSGLLQAVCGAGKTEIAAQAIQEALNTGMHVAFAIPRRQVVVELGERFQTMFPASVVKVMHQGKKDDRDADILVLTTHQLINFYQEFDLLILDEADAFPYAASPLLKRLVFKALKEDGILIKMSATLEEGENPFLPLWKLASRFHGKKLDEPEFVQVEGLEKQLHNQQLPDIVLARFSRWTTSGLQAFLFVPSIPLADIVYNILVGKGFQAGILTSRTEDKEHVLSRFRKGDILFLVATTILERGVTFRNLQAAVILAEDRVFSKAVLVQIAGRVGRFREYPSGEVVMFSEYMSPAMIRAKKEIRMMNRLRKSQG